MKAFIASLIVIVLLIAGGAWFYLNRQPTNPAEAFAYARKQQVRIEEKVAAEKKKSPADARKLADFETKLRANWRRIFDEWPESEQADEAKFFLFERDLAQSADAQEKLRLIDEFLKAEADHPKRKDVLWEKAELQRDEIKDPLSAITTFGEIETEFPDDPIAPKAALAAAQVYEAIREFGMASERYRKLAEKYPDAPEAEQAQLRLATLLEEELNRKPEAAEVYKQVAQANPGSAAGRTAERKRQKLLGDLQQDEQSKYYDDTYRVAEENPYDISKEEMNSPSMQRIREQGFDVEHYEIAVQMDPETSKLAAEVAFQADFKGESGKAILMQLNPALEIEEFTIGEKELSFEQRGPFFEFHLPGSISSPADDLKFGMKYDGEVGNWFGDTLTTSGASLRSESRWYPGSYLGDMFTQQVSIDVPEKYRAIGQGAEISDESSKSPTAGYKRFAYRQEKPTTFITIAMGIYDRTVFVGPHGLPVEINLHPEHASEVQAFSEGTLKALEVFEEMFGPFPFERLAIAEVPDFPGGYGAASLVLVGSVAFTEPGAPLKFLAHEIAHQWWGNQASLNLMNGSIPWLSEGFATYSDAVFTERTTGKEAFLNQIRTMGNFYRANIVSFEDRSIMETLWASPMYRSLMYEKGALVLHSLRREIGDEKFFSLLRRFLDENRHKVVNVDMFKTLANEIAGSDLDWFFDQHLERAGYAKLKIEEAIAKSGGEGYKLRLKITQEEPPYRMPLDLEIEMIGGEKIDKTIQVDGTTTETELGLTKEPSSLRVDPHTWQLLGGVPEPVAIQKGE